MKLPSLRRIVAAVVSLLVLHLSLATIASACTTEPAVAAHELHPAVTDHASHAPSDVPSQSGGEHNDGCDDTGCAVTMCALSGACALPMIQLVEREEPARISSSSRQRPDAAAPRRPPAAPETPPPRA
jgi:hypothetical protein